MLLALIITILFLIILFYVVLIIFYHDWNLTNLPKNLNNKNVLIIYPHPDDEVMFSFGLINKIDKKNLFLVSLTKGEKGDEVLKLPPSELGEIRKKEYWEVMQFLGVKNFEMWDFADGEIKESLVDVKSKIKEFIKLNKIGYIVTYEKTGMYGHFDHIALSKVVSELVEEDKNLKPLYATLPRKFTKKMRARDFEIELADFQESGLPKFRIGNFKGLIKKYKALRIYKSQKLSHGMPLWTIMLLVPFEYYTDIYSNKILEEKL